MPPRFNKWKYFGIEPSRISLKPMKKILIIRFSSLGDIVQSFESAAAVKRLWPDAQVHWVVRSDFAHLVESFPLIDRMWVLNKKDGLKGLRHLTKELKQEGFTHIYDAHNNLRSHYLTWKLRSSLVQSDDLAKPQFLRRPKDRIKRLLLFRLRKNLFPQPFRGAESFLRPLAPWGVKIHDLQSHDLSFSQAASFLSEQEARVRDSIVLAPSAAWELKRWPVDHWKELITTMSEESFILLGGPQDDFCEDIAQAAPDRVLNLAGQLNWMESAQAVSWSKMTISGDTGILHVADFLGRPTIGLIGPTAFGYPSRAKSLVIETDLPCKPCSKDGRGRCINPVYKRCMIDIRPEKVAEDARTLLDNKLK